VPFTGKPLFGIHPHSGIATLTTVLRGGLAYEDTTGKSGEVHAGGLEWMRAGNGVWHDGGPLPGDALRAYQLWVAPVRRAVPRAPVAPEAVPGWPRARGARRIRPRPQRDPPPRITTSTFNSGTASAGATRPRPATRSRGSR
jgi:redox-sensitive bicupin YhaK (pirin superfamily)